MTAVVADASILVPLAVDDGASGADATAALRGHRLLAPHLVRFETVQGVWNLERRLEISPTRARDAVQRLGLLQIQLHPIDELIERVWELRHNVTVYDASYVALAELVRVPLMTFDRRLARAPGLRCEVIVPGDRLLGDAEP